jgi:sensor histidine kinase regulating citrate/malate metabolism
LKHQVSVIRAETDPEKRSSYLTEIEKGMDMYGAQHKTGNTALDTILMTKNLVCAKQNIVFTCVADGALLDFMEVMDICTIFGNALDNAIEAVMKLHDPEKRLIRLALYAQNNFVMIRFENYYESEIKIEEGLPRGGKPGLLAGLPETTKGDTGYHGFGLKSIRHTVEKYHGTITIHTENDWFVLRVLVPSGL